MEAGAQVANELYTELEEEVYNELEQFVADPAFVAALEKPGGKEGLLARWTKGLGSQSSLRRRTHLGAANTGQASASAVTDANEASSEEAGEGGQGEEGWVTVDKKDAVASMAYYIAACIIDLPEAQSLSPKQLQAALVDALRMYQNPWLMRALITALWAVSRISMRILL
ncbi:hypothetical protein GPECTOR_50g612 [Gonium pectorale]|uniref:Uncharacterized protein n=1 Tax=Gonium pectorale TaxID=33097 RepID=A0A150G7L6_GONPE|nr:hypothetical protein GPECTOR_50g612 [Gonium pectorale]|eukprot:KXZ45818.1 hypothetical protein GPECTOR_50g612 [Gonium pectorale]